MANLIVPNDGKVYIDGKIIGATTPYYHLYSNDYTPDKDSHLVDFTEATFSGYAAKPSTSWGGAFLNPDVPRGVIMGDGITWTKMGATGEAALHGYWVTDGPSGALMWACRFDIARDMLIDGERIVIAPELDCISIFGNS